MVRLASKRCVITGGGSGIGEAGALIFAREGGEVSILDIDLGAAQSVRNRIQDAGGKAHAIHCDVGDPLSVEAALTESARTMGGIDICWGNAGTGDSGTAIDTPLEHWERIISINLTGMFLTAKHALPHMIEAGGGSLILTSSSGVMAGTRNVVSNMSAKGGVLGLVRQLSADFVGKGVRVNAVCPGPIDTVALRSSVAIFEQRLGQSPGTYMTAMVEASGRGRIGRAEDVANVALFLASDESEWVTAQFINVSGTGH